MKILLILVFLFLPFKSFSNELFNIKLYDDAKKYFSRTFINENKSKHQETTSGFFQINVSNKMNDFNKNSFFLEYLLVLNEYDIIHGITGIQNYKTIKNCKENLKKITSVLENKFNTTLQYGEIDNITFKTYTTGTLLSSGERLNVNCNLYDDNNIVQMWIFLDSEILTKKVNQYYQN